MSIEVTIAGKGCVVPEGDLVLWLMESGEDLSKLNKMKWTSGASRWSQGSFLMHRDNANAIAGKASQAIKVEMLDKTTGGGSVVMDRMFQINHRPIHADGLVEVQVVDERYFWQWKFAENSNTNVTAVFDRSEIYEDTDDAGSPATWAELVDRLLSELGISGETGVTLSALDPATTPYDYFVDYENAAVMLDRVCAYLGVVLVAKTELKNRTRYQIAPPVQFNDGATQIQDDNSSESKNLIAGGVMLNPTSKKDKAFLNVQMPSQVVVLFPRSESGLDNLELSESARVLNPFKVVVSTSGKPPGISGRPGSSHRIYDNTWAIGVVGSEDNDSDLTTRANSLAAHFYQRYKIAKQEGLYRGFQNIGGWPGTVEWSLSRRGAFTRASVPLDWYQYGGNKGVLEGFTNQRIVNAGGLSIGRTIDGALHLGVDSLEKEFPAIINASAAFSNRFKYGWAEAEFSGDSLSVLVGGRTGSVTVSYALNMLEVFETATYQGGVDITGTEYAASEFDRMPVGGGGTSVTHKYDVPVIMRIIRGAGGSLRYWFQPIQTSHDGECEA